MSNLITEAFNLIKNEKDFNKLSTKSKRLIKSYAEIFDNTEIQTVKENDKLYFLGKDILKILGYSMDKDNISKMLNKINSNNCKPLNEILSDEAIQKSKFTENELRKRYIDERGLHILILKSSKKETEKFQEFILDLIDQDENNTITEKNNIMASEDDIILKLTNKIDAMFISQTNIEKQNNQLMATNTKIEELNKELLQLYKKHDIKLDTIIHTL